MSKMPWVRFFSSDWLAGTRGMSAVETGVYITLIATMYERGEPVAEDHSRLSRLCGASNSAFKKALETLVEEGKIKRVEGGLWNDRVEKEQVYLSEKSEVGSKAARARWGKNDSKNNDFDDANALPVHSEGNANQKPDTITRDTSSLRSEDIDREFEDEFWKLFPRRAGKGQAIKAYRLARKVSDKDEIIAGVQRYAAERIGEDANYTAHPSTWLNGRRWLDDPTPPRMAPRSQAPPRERNILDAIDDFTGRNDHELSSGITINHDGGDPPANVHRLASSTGYRR